MVLYHIAEQNAMPGQKIFQRDVAETPLYDVSAKGGGCL